MSQEQVLKDTEIFTGNKPEVKYSPEIIRKIDVLLDLEKNLGEGNDKNDKIHEAFNWHKTIFYLLGLLSLEEMSTKKEKKKRYDIQLLTDSEYKKFDDYNAFQHDVKSKLGDSLGVIQEAEESRFGNGLLMVHSFLCVVGGKGQIICFEKINKGSGAPFQIIDLEKLYHQSLKYGIIRMEAVDKSEIRKKLENFQESESPSVREKSAANEAGLDILYKEKKDYPQNGIYKEKFHFHLEYLNK